MFAFTPEQEMDGTKIDWNKVIENLREQSNYYAKQANEWSTKSGHYDLVKEMRASANVASIMASAFRSGLSPKTDYPSPTAAPDHTA